MKTRDYGKSTGMACGGSVKRMADGGETTDMLDGSTQVNDSNRTPDYEASKDLPVSKTSVPRKATISAVTVTAKREAPEDNAPTKANADKLNKASAAQSAAYSSNEMDRLAKYKSPEKTTQELVDDALKDSLYSQAKRWLSSPNKETARRGSSPGRYSPPQKMANGGALGSFASGMAGGYATGESAKLRKSLSDKLNTPETKTFSEDSAPKKQSFTATDLTKTDLETLPDLQSFKANGGLIEGHNARQDRYRK